MSNTEHLPRWRLLSPEKREEFHGWLLIQSRLRNDVGRKRYGDIFQGDPLDQAIEEALDLLFYLWMMRRKEQSQ